jgi:hypothetical protein
MKYFLESSDPWAVINHPLEPLALKTHILISPLFVFVLGAVVTKHGFLQLREGGQRRRPSGLVLHTVRVAIQVSDRAPGHAGGTTNRGKPRRHPPRTVPGTTD